MASIRGRAWLLGGLAALAVPTLLDIATGDDAFARSLYLLPVLAVATRARPGEVAVIGVAAIAVAFLSGVLDSGDASLLPLVTVAVGSAIAVWVARERRSAIDARMAAEAERRQLRLLADAARITDGTGEIDDALRRLVDLLVPDFADAAWVDLLQTGGRPRRIAARVDGPDREELEAWLLARGSSARFDLSPTTRALRGAGNQLAELDERLRHAIVHDDDDDHRLIELSQLRWTMALPLAPGGGPLGARRARGRPVGAALRSRGPRVRGAADRPRRPRARERPARRPPHGRAAAAGRHPRRARRGGHGSEQGRPDRVREPGGGDAARAAGRARRAHRRAGRSHRPLRDPPPGRQPRDRGRAARYAGAARASTRRRC